MKSHFKLSKNKPVRICKVDLCVGLGQDGGCLRESGGNRQKYPKRKWNGKEGRRNENFKNWCKLCKGVASLERG